MKNIKKIELPIVEPILSTYHRQGTGGAIISSNPSIKNWYINACVDMHCNRKFLRGYTTPEINIFRSDIADMPCLIKQEIPLKYITRHAIKVIESALDDGKYVYFNKIDDFYIPGKTWYKERHFLYDGLIYGYDKSDRTFLIYAYDNTWVYRCFKAPIKDFQKAIKASINTGYEATLTLIIPKPEEIEISIKEIKDRLNNYISSNMKKYPPEINYRAFGIVVHEYIAMFLDRYINGSIPYEKIDKRVFRVIWEHKKLMKLRIETCFELLGITSDLAERYDTVVKAADFMRMLYASHIKKRRDSVLPTIKEKLLWINEEEKVLLNEFLSELERNT